MKKVSLTLTNKLPMKKKNGLGQIISDFSFIYRNNQYKAYSVTQKNVESYFRSSLLVGDMKNKVYGPITIILTRLELKSGTWHGNRCTNQQIKFDLRTYLNIYSSVLHTLHRPWMNVNYVNK